MGRPQSQPARSQRQLSRSSRLLPLSPCQRAGCSRHGAAPQQRRRPRPHWRAITSLRQEVMGQRAVRLLQLLLRARRLLPLQHQQPQCLLLLQRQLHSRQRQR